MAAHNWAILLLRLRFSREMDRRWRKTQAWPPGQRGTICCTSLMPIHPPFSLSLPLSLLHQLPPWSSPIPLLVICSSLTGYGTLRWCQLIVKCARSGLASVLLPDEWLNTYGAYRHSQWGPASQPRDMYSFSIAGPHLPPAPFLKWICHISEARKLPGWVPSPSELNGLNTIRRDVSKLGQFELHVNCCTMCYCLFFVTGRQALQQWDFFQLRKCYPGDFSFTPEVIGSVNHVSCVWHVPLSCPLVDNVIAN